MKRATIILIALFALIATIATSAQEPTARVTVLFDAFGAPSTLKRGWGHSALVEYGGKRILFDTGASLEDFTYNANALKVDLTRLDFVVLTHRHGDHTAGLHQVLKVNPGVQIYTPWEGGYFDSAAPPALVRLIKRRVESAPDDTHYFDGNYPERIGAGSAWPGAKFKQIQTPLEVMPGFWLFSTHSDSPGNEMDEVSMVIKTPKGLVLMVGCSHPGIEKIMETASNIEPRIYSVFGGLHLVMPDVEVVRVVASLRDRWKLERIAAGHCTGEFAFSEINRVFGERFDHAGVGAVIPLPK